MALTPGITRFLRAWESLAARCDEYSWGTVTGDSRFPDVHDANRALVVGDVSPPAADVLGALERMHRVLPVAFDQVEVVDNDAHTALTVALAESLGPPQHFLVMVLATRNPHVVRPQAVDVQETVPDRGEWTELKRAFAEGAPAHVVPQLANRDLDVFQPHGARYFVVRVDDAIAAAASLLTLEGVTLVDDVVTLPEYRGRGFAGALMAHVINAAKRDQSDELFLFASETGDAQRLYLRLGFAVVAR